MVLVRGLALFAFIPLVLWLFLVQPLGPGWSLALGVAIVAGHRTVAAPWAASHATERCLWCGRTCDAGRSLPVRSGTHTISFAACVPRHDDASRRFFAFVEAHRVAIGLGIFVPLGVLLLATLLRAMGLALLPHELAAVQFRVAVAATVVTASLAYRSAAPSREPRSVFPVHNLYLLGIRNTLWVFRVVGAWWLVAAAWPFVRLAGHFWWR